MEIQLWREILNPYDLAVKELTVKFEHLIQEHRQQGLYSPIEQVHGRVKTISSILDKAQKKNIPINEIEDKLEDIAGIRIICQFVEDIQKVVEIIRSRTDMKVIEEKDYVSNMKNSGYRSYHMIVEYTVETMNGPKRIHAEIQIRTLAMNFWATIEHSLQYKYKKNIPDHIREKLSRHHWTSQIIYHTRRRPALRRRRNAQVRQARCRLLRAPSAAAYSPHPPVHICQAFCMRHSPDSRRWAYCQGRTFLFPRPRRAVFSRFPSMPYRYSRAHWGCRSPEVPSYLLLLFSFTIYSL